MDTGYFQSQGVGQRCRIQRGLAYLPFLLVKCSTYQHKATLFTLFLQTLSDNMRQPEYYLVFCCFELVIYISQRFGPGHYVVLVIHVGGTKLSDVKLVLQREPHTGKTWFPAGFVLPNEEHVDAAVRELHEETGLILTPDDLTLLSDALVRVALLEGLQLVYVYSASVPVLFATSHLRTPAQVEQVVTAQSTINPDGTYVVPESINIDGLNLTPA
jgi:8-oxo-dGTP pyrophosphatase MutT (NUDIX family)